MSCMITGIKPGAIVRFNHGKYSYTGEVFAIVDNADVIVDIGSGLFCITKDKCELVGEKVSGKFFDIRAEEVKSLCYGREELSL